ncbi:MAG: hypothetical protein MUC61_00550 [Amoebophilaceae bacterium]|nr:hypothetical protein [Amoebophilaceae bacterium]
MAPTLNQVTLLAGSCILVDKEDGSAKTISYYAKEVDAAVSNASPISIVPCLSKQGDTTG